MKILTLVGFVLFVLPHLQLLTLQQSDNFFFDQNLYSQIQSFSPERNRFSKPQSTQPPQAIPEQSSNNPPTAPTTTTSSLTFISIQSSSSLGSRAPQQISKESEFPQQSILAAGTPNTKLDVAASTGNSSNINLRNVSKSLNESVIKNESMIRQRQTQRRVKQNNSSKTNQEPSNRTMGLSNSSNKSNNYNNNTFAIGNKEKVVLNVSNSSSTNNSVVKNAANIQNSTSISKGNTTNKTSNLYVNNLNFANEKTSNSSGKKQPQNIIKKGENSSNSGLDNRSKSFETNIKTTVSQSIQKGNNNQQSTLFSTFQQQFSKSSIQQSNSKSTRSSDPFADFGFSSAFNDFEKQFANLKKQFNAKIALRNLDEFPGITMASEVPLTFTLDQIYRFKGKISDLSTLKPSQNSITIVFMDVQNKGQFRCVEPLQNNETNFQMSCKLRMAGNFYLLIFANQGVSSRRIRRIRQKNMFISFSFDVLEPPNPENLAFSVKNNQLQIQWGSKAAITNLTIYQKQGSQMKIKRQFILSNYHQNYSLQFQYFADFKKQITYIQITHADSDDGTLYQISTKFSKEAERGELMATDHLFEKDIDEKIEIFPPIPWRIDKGASVKFTGTFKQDFNNEIYIILPNRKIIKVWFFRSSTNSPPIERVGAYTKISLEVTFPDEGIYILQVNNMAGQALINRPIYVGRIYPLLPDFVDISSYFLGPQVRKQNLEEYIKRKLMNQTTVQPNANQTLQAKRLFFLKLLNALRKTYDLNPLVIDEKLNQIAQMHSDDMRDNNFLGHTNMRGQGPEQRAKRMNFLSSVGQNVAGASTLIQAHLYLERSAGHLENSIREQWTRVGIGISRNSQNLYLVTINFSIRDLIKIPLTVEQLQKIEKQIGDIIKEKNQNLKETNKEISQEIKNWMRQPGKLSVLDYLVKVKNLRGSLSSSSFSLSFSKDMADRLRKNNLFTGLHMFKQFGLAVRPNSSNPNLLEGSAIFRV